LAGFNIIRFENVKNKFIGESERRLRLALALAESLAPVILMIDEITEALPDRSTQAADGGVSQDLLAQLYDFSSRDDLRGRVLLIACTNLPGKLDVAWHDRFQIIPFLELVPEDMVKLFPLYDKRLNGRTSLNPEDELLVEASLILHQKGASPRKVLDIVNHALLYSNAKELSSRDILTAARDYRGSASPERVAFTSLSAIALTSWQSVLPWSHTPKDYKYPWYLQDLVHRETGEVDKQKLKTKLEEYRRYLN